MAAWGGGRRGCLRGLVDGVDVDVVGVQGVAATTTAVAIVVGGGGVDIVQTATETGNVRLDRILNLCPGNRVAPHSMFSMQPPLRR
jgi:hypothetical protein